MSNVNIHCKFMHQIESTKQETNRSTEKALQNLDYLMVSDIVNDIFENALKIVVCDNQSNFQDNNPVGDTIISNRENLLNKPERKAQLEIDVKRMVEEITCERNFGVGDHLQQEQPSGEPLEVPALKFVEKKTRVTDLIKNKPELISELIKDQSPPTNLEPINERVIKVVHLDKGAPPFKVHKEINPESIALPDKDDDLMPIPSTTHMETINLNSDHEMKDGIEMNAFKRRTLGFLNKRRMVVQKKTKKKSGKCGWLALCAGVRKEPQSEDEET